MYYIISLALLSDTSLNQRVISLWKVLGTLPGATLLLFGLQIGVQGKSMFL